MSSRSGSLFPALLLAAALPAQFPGVGLNLVVPPVVDVRFPPPRFGLGIVDSISAVPEGGDSYYLAVTGRASSTSVDHASTWRYTSTTDVLTRLADFFAVARERDIYLAVSEDRRACVLSNSGVIELSTRSSPTDPWGPRTRITGLFNFSYTPRLFQVNGVEKLLALTPPPSRINVYDFDRATARASNPRSFGPPLGDPNNYLQNVGVVGHSRGGEGVALVVVERQALSARQRVYFTPAVDGSAPYFPVFDAPTGNIFDGLCQFGGGTLLLPCLKAGANSTYADTVLRLDTLMTGDTKAAASAGSVDLGLWAPLQAPNDPEFIGTLGLGLLGQSAIQIPGIHGPLGLSPGVLAVLAPSGIPRETGETSFRVNFPVNLPPSSLHMQPVIYRAGEVWLGNTAKITIQ